MWASGVSVGLLGSWRLVLVPSTFARNPTVIRACSEEVDKKEQDQDKKDQPLKIEVQATSAITVGSEVITTAFKNKDSYDQKSGIVVAVLANAAAKVELQEGPCRGEKHKYELRFLKLKPKAPNAEEAQAPALEGQDTEIIAKRQRLAEAEALLGNTDDIV